MGSRRCTNQNCGREGLVKAAAMEMANCQTVLHVKATRSRRRTDQLLDLTKVAIPNKEKPSTVVHLPFVEKC